MHWNHWKAERRVSQLTFGIIVFVGLVPAALAGGEGVTASFVMHESSPTLNEPVFVEFSIHNGLSGAIRVDLGPDRKGNFQIVVTGPDKIPQTLHRAGSQGITFFGICSVAPGETFAQELLLNEWHEFGRPGKYAVQVRFVGSILTETGTQSLGLTLPSSQL